MWSGARPLASGAIARVGAVASPEIVFGLSKATVATATSTIAGTTCAMTSAWSFGCRVKADLKVAPIQLVAKKNDSPLPRPKRSLTATAKSSSDVNAASVPMMAKRCNQPVGP